MIFEDFRGFFKIFKDFRGFSRIFEDFRRPNAARAFDGAASAMETVR